MSRTHKDSPYWVKVNREKGITYTRHNHRLFGYKQYKKAYLYNEDGAPVLEAKEAEMTEYIDVVKYVDDGAGNVKLEMSWKSREVKYTAYHHVYEIYVSVEYADYCTEDELRTANGRISHSNKKFPCVKELNDQPEWRYGEQEYRNGGYDGTRSTTKMALQKLARYATNVGCDDYEETDEEEFIYQTKIPKIWL